MSGSDPYTHAIRQAAHDAVRALVSAEPDSMEGLVALRDVVSWLGRCYGPDALRDLAEELAAELADALQVLAAAKGRPSADMLNAWYRHDAGRDSAIDGNGDGDADSPADRTGSSAAPPTDAGTASISSPVLAPERPRSRRRPRSRWW